MTMRATRRTLLTGLGCGCMAGAMSPFMASAVAADSGPANKTNMTAAEALDALRKGNADFVADKPMAGAMSRQRRLDIAKGQTPFAVLVGCSDSRVPPELLFGRGLGELFIIRVAGNSVDRTALGSIQYGVAALGCPLVVVLGHERCGAVQAAVQAVKEGTNFPGAIGDMVAPIVPAALAAQKQGAGDVVENSVRENVRRVAKRLRESDDILSDAVRAKTVQVVGAYYRLDDGTVDFFDGA